MIDPIRRSGAEMDHESSFSTGRTSRAGAMPIAPGSSPVSGDSAMTSRRWSTLVSGLILMLALAAGGSARAQIDLDDIPCIPYPNFSVFDLGYGLGSAEEFSPFDFGYGSFGAADYGGFGGIGTSSLTGFGRSIGQGPQTTASFQPRYDALTSVPSSKVSKHRVRRRCPRNSPGMTSRIPAGSSARVGKPLR